MHKKLDYKPFRIPNSIVLADRVPSYACPACINTISRSM